MRKFIFRAAVVSALFTSTALKADEYMFFPKQTVTDYLKPYNDEEKIAIEKDLEVVRKICLPEKTEHPAETPIYIATAGGPGSRKSTILERYLKNQPPLSYIDPDQRALKFMVHTYCQWLSALNLTDHQNFKFATKAAYEKWRNGSMYIAYTLLEEAFGERRNVAQGATSTGEHIPASFARLKKNGYQIVLLLCSCEDAFRQKAIEYRNEEQKFYQSTPEDAVAKGKLFPQRMATYFTFGDTLHLYWNDDLTTKERLAATFSSGELKILDSDAYNRFTAKYENDRMMLEKEGKKLLAWNELVELYKNRF